MMNFRSHDEVTVNRGVVVTGCPLAMIVTGGHAVDPLVALVYVSGVPGTAHCATTSALPTGGPSSYVVPNVVVQRDRHSAVAVVVRIKGRARVEPHAARERLRHRGRR